MRYYIDVKMLRCQRVDSSRASCPRKHDNVAVGQAVFLSGAYWPLTFTSSSIRVNESRLPSIGPLRAEHALQTSDGDMCLSTPRAEGSALISEPAAEVVVPQPGVTVGVPLEPPLGSSAGWIWAVAILFASRLGRLTAQEARLDVRQLQLDRERSRALSKDLLQKRLEYEAEEVSRVAAAAARRVEEEAARALEEFERQQELQKRYQEEAAREAERVRAFQEAKKQEYEQEQARLDAEYQARVELEKQLIEEQRARAAAAEAERRRIEAERRQQQQEEKRRREEEERLQREEIVRKKVEERRRLEKEKKRFALRMDFSLELIRPPKGTIVAGPLPKEASLRISCHAETLLGGAIEPSSTDLVNANDLGETLPLLVGSQARAACDAYSSAVRLQSMTGEGPLTWMDEVELRYWMAISATRSAISVLAKSQGAEQNLPFKCKIQTRTEYGVLPAEHPKKLSTQLDRTMFLIESGLISDARALLMGDLALEAKHATYSDLTSPPACLDRCPPFLGIALLCSHLVDRSLHERQARVSDAPAWFEAVVAVVREILHESTAAAGQDTLQSPAALLNGVLGENNPVAIEVAQLAEANLSSTYKEARNQRDRLAKAELAAKLLASAEEEWPDADELKAARLADKEAKTPIPERIWALRNVAGTLALGGLNEKGRARTLLEKSVLLKQQFAQASDHPGVLPELCALFELLRTQAAWEEDARGVAVIIMTILTQFANAYVEDNDKASATVVLEAGLRSYEDILGVRHPQILSTLRKVERLNAALTAEQRSRVASLRGDSKKVLDRLCAAMTEPLQAYQASSMGGPSVVEQWNIYGTQIIGRFC